MSVCCCTLAGTRACDNCAHGPSRYLGDTIFRHPYYTPTIPEPVSVKKKIKRIIYEYEDET